VTQGEWLTCPNLSRLLAFLRGKTTARKRILFGCGCCRLLHRAFLGRYPDLLVRLGTIERYADGEAEEWEYTNATRVRIWTLGDLVRPGGPPPALPSAEDREGQPVLDWLCHPWATAKAFAGQGAAPILRDVLWPSPKPAQADRPASEGGLVPRLARAAYDERLLPGGMLDLARLTVLADALEDAGCTDQAVISHLRSPGFHVRGCWPVDLLLANE
jgi:hypothetical protein